MEDRSSGRHNLPLLLALFLGVFTFVMGFWGLLQAGQYQFDWSWKGFNGFSELFYDSVRLLLMDSAPDAPTNFYYSVARIGAVLFVSLGILGILKEISRSVKKTLRMAWFQFITVLGIKPVVIIGLGRVGMPLVKDIRKKKVWGIFRQPVYAISQQDNPANLDLAFDEGAIVIQGDATNASILEKKIITQALEFFIATGDDSRNLEIAAKLKKQFPDEDSKPEKASRICQVHLSDTDLTNSVKEHKLFEEHKKDIVFNYFSTPNMAARDLLSNLFLDQGLGLFSKKSDVSAEASQTDSDRDREKFKIPEEGDVFHLFIFGFGEIGQALARNTASLAHFKSLNRSRITVIGNSDKDRQAWNDFLDKHPGFSEKGLDLSHVSGSEKSSPESTELDVKNMEDLVRKLELHAVEHAVDAEFMELSGEVINDSIEDRIKKRLQHNDPDVKAALAFCFENERLNFEMALDIQYGLSRSLIKKSPTEDDILPCEKDISERQLPIPLFAHLPADKGLADLLKSDLIETGDDEVLDIVNHYFPIDTFGDQSKIYQYDVIKKSEIINYTQSLKEIYQASKSDSSAHPDFEDSDMYAALLTEVKCEAMGIKFSKNGFEDFKGKPKKVIFDDYFDTEEIRHAKAKLNLNEEKHTCSLDWFFDKRNETDGKGNHPYRKLLDRTLFLGDLEIEEKKEFKKYIEEELSLEEFKEKVISDVANIKYLRNRWKENSQHQYESLSNDDITEKFKTVLEEEFEKNCTASRNDSLKTDISRYKNAYVKLAIKKIDLCLEESKNAVLRSFEHYFKGTGIDVDIAAKIEHNRWMGERLVHNWSFGVRDNFKKTRITFVPWDYVPHSDYINPSPDFPLENHRSYDSQMIPKIIMDQRVHGMYAYVHL
ncbi:MAG: hypothetical protein GVY20_02990 [Bacteroidetes bacterium]|jgi:hypothetical protein|nr:hypothetical protein [Bacteroidota bacterium]